MTMTAISRKSTRKPTHRHIRPRTAPPILWLLYPALAVIFSELVLKLWCFRALTGRGALLTLLLSGAAGLS